MGVIFALSSEFYYWMAEIIGQTKNFRPDPFNMTFFPMHSGTPRQIPQYTIDHFQCPLAKMCN